MKKRLGSVRAQIIITSIVSMAVLQIMLVSIYYQFRELIVQDNRMRFQELLTQVTSSVELSCVYLNDILEQIAYSSEIQAYLENADLEYRRRHQEQILSLLNSMAKLKSGIKDIAVMDSKGNCTNLNGNIYQVQQLAEEIPEKCLYYYTAQNELMLTRSQKVEGFAVGTQVYSTSDFTRKEKMGTILISFNIPCIFNFARYGEHEKLPSMLVYDREDKLAFSSAAPGIDTSYELYFDGQEQILEEVTFGDQVYYIESGDLDMLDGKIVFLISKEETLSGMERLQDWLALLAVLNTVIMLILGLTLIKRIVHPLNQFMEWLSELKNGNLKLMKQTVLLRGATEVVAMAEQFNGMMQEINDLTHRLTDTTSRLYEIELEKQQAELEYMYSQVNPHFLFNTLESVKGCAIEEDARRTFEMVNALGKIFRYCVRSGNMVTLREETGVADSYMHLQQIRFEKRLTYYNRVREEILEAVIPKMVLQPLLENAVIHGVEEDGASSVWLDGWVSEGIITLTVTDDGTGIGKEKMAELQTRMWEKGEPSHIGIGNIYNRLRYVYGEPYGLELMDKETGFGVMIRIPMESGQVWEKGD